MIPPRKCASSRDWWRVVPPFRTRDTDLQNIMFFQSHVYCLVGLVAASCPCCFSRVSNIDACCDRDALFILWLLARGILFPKQQLPLKNCMCDPIINPMASCRYITNSSSDKVMVQRYFLVHSWSRLEPRQSGVFWPKSATRTAARVFLRRSAPIFSSLWAHTTEDKKKRKSNKKITHRSFVFVCLFF